METLTFLLTSTFYPPYHIGGDAVHVKYLADELVKKGHNVHVLHSLDAYNIKRKVIPKKVNSNSIHTHTIKTKFNLSSYASYIFGKSSTVDKTFESLVKELKPDVVHHHNISLLGYNLLKKRGNYINLYTAHDYWLICQRNNLLLNTFKECADTSCFSCAFKSKKLPQLWRRRTDFTVAKNNIDSIISPSYYMATKLKHLGIPITVLPNFVPNGKNKTIIDNTENFIIYAGLLEEHKGILNLIKIFNKIHSEIDYKLIVAGDGSLKVKIENFIEANHLGRKWNVAI